MARTRIFRHEVTHIQHETDVFLTIWYEDGRVIGPERKTCAEWLKWHMKNFPCETPTPLPDPGSP